MSFLRHEEIYRPMQKRERPAHDRPRPHRYDEFPAGYSSAGCAPAEPASASPAEAHLAGIGPGSTIELHRTVNRLLTPCLTQGDNPSISRTLKPSKTRLPFSARNWRFPKTSFRPRFTKALPVAVLRFVILWTNFRSFLPRLSQGLPLWSR